MRETVGYLHAGKRWCPECIPLPLKVLEAGRLPPGTNRITKGPRSKGSLGRCSRCGYELGQPITFENCPCPVHSTFEEVMQEAARLVASKPGHYVPRIAPPPT